jgi:hypothetical protein
MANGGILNREDVITTARLTIVAASARVPLGLLVEHHVMCHMDTLRDGIVHAIHLRATLVANEDHLMTTVL